MSELIGILNIEEAEAERTYVNTVGQAVVYDAVRELLTRYNQELAAAKAVFVDGTTDKFKFRYKLPGGGRLQQRSGLVRPGAVRAGGSWDVSLPLKDFGASVGGDEISMAYMTVAELDRHMDTVFIQDTNTVRFEMLYALLHGAAVTFADEIHGSLTIQPLANGDSVLYPPVMGSESEATDSHLYGTNYLATAISDTNNPFATIVAELEEHWGAPQGNSNIVTYINPAEVPETEALTDFEEVPDRFLVPGQDTAVPTGLPRVPGRIIGRVSGSWVSEWRWIPAGYALGQHLDAPKPLRERVDPADTGLPRGLSLVSKSKDYPLEASQYIHRFGFGVVNRISCVALHITNSTSYTAPTAYA